MQYLALPRLAAAIACCCAAADALPAELEVEGVVVRGKRERAMEADGRPQTVLSGDALRRNAGGTLGDTVAESPGTHSASFGAGVGLPVIRGFTGSRVKVSVDGISTNDASSASPDHAVAVESMLAEEVRILRGPETVRYGSGAIGGAVEVSDGRIASRRLERAIEGRAELRYGTNGNEKAGAAKLKTGSGPWVLSADGFGRRRGDTEIPGYAIDAQAVQQQFGVPVTSNTLGYVENSDLRNHGGGLGLSYVGERGWVGVSGGMLSNDYGIPSGAHSHGTGTPSATELERVRIAMEQTRFDTRAELRTEFRGLSTVRVRAAQVDYRHDEIANGVVATTFLNKAFEYRLEADHRPWERLNGTLGLHGVDRTFSATGAEAFVPKSVIDALGLYAIERLDLGLVRFEAAYRAEEQSIRPDPQLTVFGSVRTFPQTTYRPSTLSLGAAVPLPKNSRVSLTWSRPERAPDVQELYSLGPHLATRTFDLGQPNLRKEALTRWDLGFNADWNRLAVTLNWFRYDATDYIYARNTGLFYRLDIASIRPTCISLDECLPVIQYDQQDAAFHGHEAQATLRIPEFPKGPLDLTVFSDAVNGAFANGAGDVPRLPPRRTGLELVVYPGDRATLRMRWTHASSQDRPGVNETPTAGYDLVNLQFEYLFRAFGREESTFYVHLRNLLDEEIRNSTSFLRSFAPEPGRRLDVGVRFEF